MGFALLKDHKDFYYKHGYVEFEGLLKSQDVTAIQDACESIVANRMGTDPSQLEIRQLEDCFMAGRDIWRESNLITKKLCAKAICEIAAQLCKTSVLRIAWDQYLSSGTNSARVFSTKSKIKSFLSDESLDLSTRSSLQSPVCFLLVKLSHAPAEKFTHRELDEESPVNPVPMCQGNISIIKADGIFTLKEILERNCQNYLLLALCPEKACYVYHEQDPHTHNFKKHGLVFGDKISPALCPVVYRS